jgi:hypothetical protein
MYVDLSNIYFRTSLPVGGTFLNDGREMKAFQDILRTVKRFGPRIITTRGIDTKIYFSFSAVNFINIINFANHFSPLALRLLSG